MPYTVASARERGGAAAEYLAAVSCHHRTDALRAEIDAHPHIGPLCELLTLHREFPLREGLTANFRCSKLC
ncbi:hypothetical protein GCM10010207_09040 [Streptomyces atratus]|nr:hypothetical protein GCM10010207_09040 [Streptomyces atratus]